MSRQNLKRGDIVKAFGKGALCYKRQRPKSKGGKGAASEMKKIYRIFAGALSVLMISALSLSLYAGRTLPDYVYIAEGQEVEDLDLSTAALSGTAITVGAPVQQAVITEPDQIPVGLRIFGAISVKDILVQVVPREYVLPGGTPFGIKMFTDGVMVVGMTDVINDGETINPAKDAGIRLGDVITKVNGRRVSTNEEVASFVEKSNGSPLTVQIRRDDQELFEASVIPVRSDDAGGYRAGMWVRDSSAGIGTMTFIDPESGCFAGLGHGVCDIDTGNLMPLSSGEAVDVTITGVTKGMSGSPGELRGAFSESRPMGVLLRNDVTGVYGQLNSASLDWGSVMPTPVAMRQEVKPGKAIVRTTVDGEEAMEYEIVIERVTFSDSNPTRNMVVRITDPRLLAKTGGIVQGMSGSPILQNGKLVGAITHVFVNDPARGYGIFAENMEQCLSSLGKMS